MNISKKTWILVLILLLVILAGCKKAPTKTIFDLEDSHLVGNPVGEDKVRDARSIVDAQGNVLFSKTIDDPGAPLGSIFIIDRNIICGNYEGDFTPTTLGKGGGIGAGNCNSDGIKSYIESRGAKTKGDRTPLDFYPLNQVRLNNNLLDLSFWTGEESMQTLLRFEKENLILSGTQSALPDRTKEFFFEEDRVCIQGGQMISNLIYYSHENPSCHNKKNADCRATFVEFPLFKTCLSLTDLRQTFRVPETWEDYSVSCGFNENFATLPSLIRGTNIGFSNCIYKNLGTANETIVTGFGVGNPTIEAESSELSIIVDNFFRGQEILENSSSSISLNSRTFRQEIVNYGKGMIEDNFISKDEESLRFEKKGSIFVKTYDGEQCDPSQDTIFCILERPILTYDQMDYLEQWHTDSENNNVLAVMQGSKHTDNMGSDNYLFLEYNEVTSQNFEKYRIKLTDNNEYFVYINPTTQWFALANYDFDLESSFNQEYFESFYTPERLYVRKQIGDKVYILTEESETLYFKSQTIFVPENPHTTLPVYYLRIEGATPNMCQELFGLYNFRSATELSTTDHMVCQVEGGVLNAKLNEHKFSSKFSEGNLAGAGYVLLRNIIFPLNNNIDLFS